MMDDERMENLSEEVREPEKEPMTIHDKIFVILLWLVTTLWVALVIRIGGWIVWWIREMLR